jgi:hypothetical protein
MRTNDFRIGECHSNQEIMLVVLGELSINPTMTQGTLDGLRFGDGWLRSAVFR